MKRLLLPAAVGVTVARHVAWYLSYKAFGDSRA